MSHSVADITAQFGNKMVLCALHAVIIWCPIFILTFSPSLIFVPQMRHHLTGHSAFTSAVLAVTYGAEYVLAPQGPQEATAGTSPVLNCSYTFTDNTRLRVTWWFGPTAERTCKISNQIWLSSSLAFANETKHKSNGMEVNQLMGDNWSTLELKNVTQNYSGWYFCQVTVEIPNLHSICSNGTKLNISKCL